MDYFPYPSLRPYQDRMLDAVYDTVRRGDHGILMLDAPTGCGKTSCISAALAAAPGKIVVAVRTISQIDIYLEELGRIWGSTHHRPEVSYMVGKAKVCPFADEFGGESVYSACSRLKEWSKNYMTTKLRKGGESVYIAERDSIPEEMPGNRTFCPCYLRSREAFDLNGKIFFRRSTLALDAVERLKKKINAPEDLLDICEGLCPYEVMALYAKTSDLIIMNYSHLFSPDFQEIIFQWLELDSEKVTVFVDEAHNLGDAVRGMNTRALTIRMIDLAETEVGKFEKALGQATLAEASSMWRREGIKAIRLLLPRLKRFILSRESRMPEGEALLDTDMFRGFLYDGIDDIEGALSNISEVSLAVAEMRLAEGDSENLQGEIQPNLAQVLLFLMEIEQAEEDRSYQAKVSSISSGDRRWTRLEVTRIDPAPVIRRITDNVNATVMLSGTLSPLEAYELYCLGEEGRATKLSLPNPFPRENRLLMVAKRATTRLGSREDADNRREITSHIGAVVMGVPGNVALFFTSYAMMNSYREFALAYARKANKRLFSEPRAAEDVPMVLDQFFRQGCLSGGVLMGVCGGKLAEGIDYKGEALYGVAVIGLPLGVFDEIQREINDYYSKKYGKEKGLLIAYTLPAINKGLQAAGRVIRAESEKGVILFCDSRFNSLGPGGVKQYLPSWVAEELVSVDARESVRAIREKEIDWGRSNASCK
ncbi:MAG: ATP-dependent DNA helicase [Methanotrichaceae archaeon]|nr:ATP-dependent DNA helicase [Methanotrichaceae archaeon]